MHSKMNVIKSETSVLGVQLSVAAIMFCFAANSIITRYLVLGDKIAPLPLTVIRFVSGLATILIVALTMPNVFKKEKLSRKHSVGALFLGIYAFAISYGYALIPAAAGALVFYCFVVFTMSLYAVAVNNEKLTARLAASQILGIIGVFVITFAKLGAVSLWGVILMAVTGVSWGLYSVYGTRFQSYFGYTYNSFLVFGVVSMFIIPVDYAFVNPTEWQSISLPSLGLALFMGLISTGLSYILWNKVLRRVGASLGGLAQLIVPILTAVMGILLLSEKISLSLILGGALILSGIYISVTRPKEAKTESRQIV